MHWWRLENPTGERLQKLPEPRNLRSQPSGFAGRGLVNATQLNHPATRALDVDAGDAVTIALNAHLRFVRVGAAGDGGRNRKGRLMKRLEGWGNLGVTQNGYV
jgi:hypothetical protein